MRADYDSEADALSIDLIQFDLIEGQDSVHDTYCQVAFARGRPANVELLSPASHLDLLSAVAERYELDGDALLAAAQAALAAPDRLVELKLGATLVA
ncbi:MAG TPA: hypothetical protein VG898_01930 [Solirubrobacterales bacterium]|nr:hypothetical protein [Solirubrobacterales bacterium]